MKYAYENKFYTILFTFLDLIGGFLFLPFRLFLKKSENDLRRILLIRCDHIGDVINATCVLEPLRKRFPDAVIDFMVSSGLWK